MKTRKTIMAVVSLVILFVTAFGARGEARVEVNVGVTLPAYTSAAPPPVVVMPGTYLYFVPIVEFDSINSVDIRIETPCLEQGNQTEACGELLRGQRRT
jgi:hypothetical protein